MTKCRLLPFLSVVEKSYCQWKLWCTFYRFKRGKSVIFRKAPPLFCCGTEVLFFSNPPQCFRACGSQLTAVFWVAGEDCDCDWVLIVFTFSLCTRWQELRYDYNPVTSALLPLSWQLPHTDNSTSFTQRNSMKNVGNCELDKIYFWTSQYDKLIQQDQVQK